MKHYLGLIALLLLTLLLSPTTVQAVVNPLAVPNNKFGIHLISSTVDESSPASQLVNSSGGDWGYVTVLVRSSDRNHDMWQEFFNDLRRRHLIPLVRLATQAEGNHWKRPYEGEEQAWADFLDSLVWPTKNRYVIIYNEPNQGQEWAGSVDPVSYAKVLDKTITTLKAKNSDFFVLNAGLDASAPPKPPAYQDEVTYLQQMDQAVPGIFNKLDGWVSHSYPNPGFAGSPDDQGKGTVRTWAWEQQQLRNLGLTKILPIFITETGWKHSEGVNYDKSLPTSEVVAGYYKQAFQTAWNTERIVAVTPFLLDYQTAPFDHFSFKKLTGEVQNNKVLGVQDPPYYAPYQTLTAMSKIAGQPQQEEKAQLTKGGIPPSLVTSQSYTFELTFKNTGQSIWGERGPVSLVATQGQQELGITPVILPNTQKVEPGQENTFLIHLNAPQSGTFPVSLQLYNGNQPFEQEPLKFNVEIKSPVKLALEAALKWQKDPSGEYLLSAVSNFFSSSSKVQFNSQGKSAELDNHELLPDQTVDFTLTRPYYLPKTVRVTLHSGVNDLNFGELQPDFSSVLWKPIEFLKLLPF